MTMNCIEQDLIPLSVIEDIKAEINYIMWEDDAKIINDVIDKCVDKYIDRKE